MRRMARSGSHPVKWPAPSSPQRCLPLTDFTPSSGKTNNRDRYGYGFSESRSSTYVVWGAADASSRGARFAPPGPGEWSVFSADVPAATSRSARPNAAVLGAPSCWAASAELGTGAGHPASDTTGPQCLDAPHRRHGWDSALRGRLCRSGPVCDSRPCPALRAFIPYAANDLLRGGRSVTRLVRFRTWKSVWFEEAMDSPDGQRNPSLRRAHDHGVP